MKKFSGIVLSFVLLLVLFVGGCTYADKATLVSIKDKYNYISSNNQDNLFVGDDFNPVYNSGNLHLAITDNDIIKFNCLKSSGDRNNIAYCNVYGLLFRAINSTFSTTDALSISYDKITEKQYKKNMYTALENFQRDIEKLKTHKKSLESVFNNSSKSYLDVAEEETANYNLNNYLNSLNVCLNELLDFNRNYHLALVNNISKPISIEDLFEKTASEIELNYSAYHQLINNCNILISNYILTYSVNLIGNINENSQLIDCLKELLILQNSPKMVVGEADKIENYKMVRVLEDSVNKNEQVFVSCCKNLTKETVTSEDEKYSYNQNLIKSYANKLITYSNKLISYLKSLS